VPHRDRIIRRRADEQYARAVGEHPGVADRPGQRRAERRVGVDVPQRHGFAVFDAQQRPAVGRGESGDALGPGGEPSTKHPTAAGFGVPHGDRAVHVQDGERRVNVRPADDRGEDPAVGKREDAGSGAVDEVPQRHRVAPGRGDGPARGVPDRDRVQSLAGVHRRGPPAAQRRDPQNAVPAGGHHDGAVGRFRGGEVLDVHGVVVAGKCSDAASRFQVDHLGRSCPVPDHGERPAVDQDGDQHRRVPGAVVTDVAHGSDQSAGPAVPDPQARLRATLAMQLAEVAVEILVLVRQRDEDVDPADHGRRDGGRPVGGEDLPQRRVRPRIGSPEGTHRSMLRGVDRVSAHGRA
jgi:hypothetical protein